MVLVFRAILICFFTGEASAQVNSADTVKVDIKVTLTPKLIIPDTALSEALSKEAKGHKDRISRSYSKVENGIKTNIASSQSSNKKSLASTPEAVYKPSDNALQDTTGIIKQKGPASLKGKSGPGRSIYFLSGLLLVITGTLLAVFFRSGAPLVAAIILLITGYYILIYTLLFMFKS